MYVSIWKSHDEGHDSLVLVAQAKSCTIRVQTLNSHLGLQEQCASECALEL